jgi:hypothetical protein
MVLGFHHGKVKCGENPVVPFSVHHLAGANCLAICPWFVGF